MAMLRPALLLLACLPATAQTTSAQHHHYRSDHYTPGYHIDHHDHIVRDGHGHVIARYHHDIVYPNSTYIIPHASRPTHHGAYHVRNDRNYYIPSTAPVEAQHVVSTPVVVEVGSFSHPDDLAARLESLVNEFLLDLHFNYSHNHGFRETYAEAYQLLEVARFVHAAEHQDDRQSMRYQLNGMDTMFHHIQDDVRGWSRQHHRQTGRHGILSKMDMIQSALHHLMNDVGVHQTPVAETYGQAPPLADVAIAPLTTTPPPSTLP